MRTILAIMLCTALGGCMTTQYTWEKPGNDQSEFKRANYRCMQEAQQRVTNVYDGSVAIPSCAPTNSCT